MAMKNIIFFDLETTSKDIFKAEMLTGAFKTNHGDQIYFESQVDVWCDEAAKIHKISYGEMKTFPEKYKAHKELYYKLKPYEKDFIWICYANPFTKYGTISFDRGVLINSFLEVLGKDFRIEGHLTVYNLVVEAAKRGLFTPIRAKNKSGKMQISYSQPNVYKAIFDRKYDAHKANSDVNAMIEIYDKVTYALKHNTPMTSGQAKLI